MTRNVGNSWPSQSPPADFADRAVDAMLRDGKRTAKRPRPRRWLGLLAIAAVLVAGGAWARMVLPKMPLARSEPAAAAATTSGAKAAPAIRDPEANPQRAPPPPPVLTTPQPPLPRRVRAPATSPDAGHIVRVPMCNCVQSMCDCGQEP